MALFQAVEENLREAMRCYSFVCDDGDVGQLPGVSITSSGVNFSVFNSVMFTSEIEDMNDLERRVNLGEIWFTQRALGRSYWVCDDLIPWTIRRKARKWFETNGMHIVAEPPGMACEQLSPVSRLLPSLDIRPVNDARTRTDFVDVACTVFALPYHVGERIYGAASTWDSPMKGWVGYVSRRPVTIVSTVLGGGAVGIYSLATAPDHQGCGYAEAIMRYALDVERAQTGVERTVLQTTRSGRRLYERMGFKVVTKFTVFARESCGSL